MAPSDVATALDYTDALAVTRKAGRWLALFILILLAGELALFFVFRYRIDLRADAAVLGRTSGADLVQYAVGLVDFLGVLLPGLLAIDLLLIVNIMLVGRLIGVARVIRGFLLCAVLIVLLFPWQAFLANATFTSAEFKVPGVLYTWDELLARGRWDASFFSAMGFLRWARFVGFPVLSIVLLAAVQVNCTRGLKLAQGDALAEPRIK